jgi:hypothetical protein
MDSQKGRLYLVQQLRLPSRDMPPCLEEVEPSEAIHILRDIIRITRERGHRYWLEWRRDDVAPPR